MVLKHGKFEMLYRDLFLYNRRIVSNAYLEDIELSRSFEIRKTDEQSEVKAVLYGESSYQG